MSGPKKPGLVPGLSKADLARKAGNIKLRDRSMKPEAAQKPLNAGFGTVYYPPGTKPPEAPKKPAEGQKNFPRFAGKADAAKLAKQVILERKGPKKDTRPNSVLLLERNVANELGQAKFPRGRVYITADKKGNLTLEITIRVDRPFEFTDRRRLEGAVRNYLIKQGRVKQDPKITSANIKIEAEVIR